MMQFILCDAATNSLGRLTALVTAEAHLYNDPEETNSSRKVERPEEVAIWSTKTSFVRAREENICFEQASPSLRKLAVLYRSKRVGAPRWYRPCDMASCTVRVLFPNGLMNLT